MTKTTPPAQRFWRKINMRGPMLSPYLGPCWLCQGWTDWRGYGRFLLNGRKVVAHRFAYEVVRGPIPEGLELDHLCRVTSCVNPAHLEAVTHRENLRRGPQGRGSAVMSAKTHCPQGHPYDEVNTYVTKQGGRQCRTCTRLRSRARRTSAR